MPCSSEEIIVSESTAAPQALSSALFRNEVLIGKQTQWLGEILIVRPLSFSFLSAFSLSIAGAIFLFLIFGEYTRKERVSGQVVVSQGLVKLYSPVAGSVLKRLVNEGDKVVKGQPLYVVSTERTSVAKGDTQAAIAQQLETRRISLQTEIIKQRIVLQEEEAALRKRIQDSEAELAQLGREVVTQQDRYRLNTENLQRFQELAKQEIISQSELHERQQDSLNLRAQLEALQRNRITIQKDISSLQTDLRNAPLKAANQLASIERNIAEIEQQVVDNEVRREISIPAQVDGMVTAVLAEVGQVVGGNTPLLGLLPEGSKFEAQLFVPSRAVGFMKIGNQVLLRYQAFPYQKFGQYFGRVKEISRTALSPSELQLTGFAQETSYRVTVVLDSQTVTTYGQPANLQDGMQLEADVLVDTRKLYEWVLEPLFSLTGRY